MRPYDPERMLVSVHIPKCAGTSFGEVLKAWFGERFHDHYPDDAIPGPPARIESRARTCVHGHFYHHDYPIGVYDYYPDCAQMITVLRDPLEMMISSYFFQRHAGTAEHTSVEDYLDAVLGWGELLYYRNLPFDVGSPEAIDIVEETFVWIGLADRLSDGVGVLARRLGHKRPARLPVLNVAPRDGGVPEGYESKFRRTFEGEYRFYDALRWNIERELDR